MRLCETRGMSGEESAPQGRPEQYHPPQVEQIPTEDGPAVTAAGKSRGSGPEWEPRAPFSEEPSP